MKEREARLQKEQLEKQAAAMAKFEEEQVQDECHEARRERSWNQIGRSL